MSERWVINTTTASLCKFQYAGINKPLRLPGHLLHRPPYFFSIPTEHAYPLFTDQSQAFAVADPMKRNHTDNEPIRKIWHQTIWEGSNFHRKEITKLTFRALTLLSFSDEGLIFLVISLRWTLHPNFCFSLSHPGQCATMAVFTLEDALSVGTNLGKHSLLVVGPYYKDGHKTHYPSRRTIFCCGTWTTYNSSSRRIMRPLV